MTEFYDVTLTEDDDNPGKLMAHKPDCLVVDRHRRDERQLMTLFACAEALPPDVRRHECLETT